MTSAMPSRAGSPAMMVPLGQPIMNAASGFSTRRPSVLSTPSSLSPSRTQSSATLSLPTAPSISLASTTFALNTENLLKTWNLKSAETQTNETDLPNTELMLTTLSQLRADLDYQSTLLHTQAAAGQAHAIDRIRESLTEQAQQIQDDAQLKVRRARTAAQVQMDNTTKAIEAYWSNEANKRIAAANAHREWVEQVAGEHVREARQAARDAADQALAAKVQLTRVMGWVKSNCNRLLAEEEATKTVQQLTEAANEGDQMANVVVELQRRVDERDLKIAELVELLEKMQMEAAEAMGMGKGAAALMYQLGKDAVAESLSSVRSLGQNAGTDWSRRSSSASLATGGSRSGVGSAIGLVGAAKKSAKFATVVEEREGGMSTSALNQSDGSSGVGGGTARQSSMRLNSAGGAGTGGGGSGAVYTNPDGVQVPIDRPGRWIADEELETIVSGHLARADDRWAAKLQKSRILYEKQLSDAREQIRQLKEQLNNLQKGLVSISNPAAISNILSRQRTILEVAAALFRPPSPPPSPPASSPTLVRKQSMAPSKVGVSKSGGNMKGTKATVIKRGSNVSRRHLPPNLVPRQYGKSQASHVDSSPGDDAQASVSVASHNVLSSPADLHRQPEAHDHGSDSSIASSTNMDGGSTPPSPRVHTFRSTSATTSSSSSVSLTTNGHVQTPITSAPRRSSKLRQTGVTNAGPSVEQVGSGHASVSFDPTPPMAIASTPHLPSAFPSSNSLTASTTVFQQPQPQTPSTPTARHQPPPTMSTPMLTNTSLPPYQRATTGKLPPKPPRTPSLSTPTSAAAPRRTSRPAVDLSRSSTINNNNPHMSSEVTHGPALPRFPPSQVPAHHARQVANGGGGESASGGGVGERARAGKGPVRVGPAGGVRAGGEGVR